jgi:hypothetical protein
MSYLLGHSYLNYILDVIAANFFLIYICNIVFKVTGIKVEMLR